MNICAAGNIACKKLGPVKTVLEDYLAPVIELGGRLYLANAFFMAGLTRFSDWKTGNFGTQVFLFESEHPVPGIPPEAAAYMSMIGELTLPFLVAFGLMGRIGAVGLLVMTIVIELTYIHTDEHLLWGFIAAMIVARGPGKISLDHWLLKGCCKDKA